MEETGSKQADQNKADSSSSTTMKATRMNAKPLTTPAVRKIVSDNKVCYTLGHIFEYIIFFLDRHSQYQRLRQGW